MNASLRRVFETLVRRPLPVLIISFLFVIVSAAGLTRLVKDTSVRAFIPHDHSSILTEDRIDEIFGLTDPIAIAVMSDDGGSIFTAERLEVVRALTRKIQNVQNIRADRVASLATESAILGTDDAVLVEPYIPDGPISPEQARASGSLWLAMPPHQGTLVAEDQSGAVIMAEVNDPSVAAKTYAEIQELSSAADYPGVDIHIAGPAAVSAYLSQRIDGDARVMQPLVFVIVLLFIYLAFRRAAAVFGPMLVVVGAAAGALGIMAWNGIPYFAITNALPVIIVAIAVADAIHILSHYYRLTAVSAQGPSRDRVVNAMVEMARPITLTTLTTMAGFIGIAVVSIMPPIFWFACYAALGVALAWIFSMVTLPSALVLMDPGPSPAFSSWAQGRPNRLGALFMRISLASARHYGMILGGFVCLTGLAGYNALDLRVDRSQVENFAPGEPIRVADELIAERFAGTNFLDVVVTSDAPEGLLSEAQMARIAGLQSFMESLPGVQITVSIADYLSLLHRAIATDEGAPLSSRPLPDEPDSIAQYLLVYEASGDPADLEEEIDAGYETALIRGVLDTAHFSKTREVVERLQQHIDDEFNGDGLQAVLGGDVNVTYHWMSRLERSHFEGVALSLAMVLVMSIAVFRSLAAGLVAVVPVTFTVLVIYGLMAAMDVYLEPATSMFAAISVGVGVDFAIHLVDRLRLALRLNRNDLEEAIRVAVPGTARACFFNAAALGLGFSVMLASQLPMLQRFGGLVATAALVSFMVGLVVIPAAYAASHQLRMRFAAWANTSASRLAAALVLTGGLGFAAVDVRADSTLPNPAEGLRVATQVADRAEASSGIRTIEMVLTDGRGRAKEREALILKMNLADQERTRIVYLSPRSIQDTSFMSYDYHDPEKVDDRWLYLPATRKVRRIPASDRGDYFLGTDFTYEDIQSDLKFELGDYRFGHEGMALEDGRTLHVIVGEPVSEQVARELGYGGFRAWVDEVNWMPARIEFVDTRGEPLKSVEVRAVEQIDGIWTATDIEARHHQTGHSTRFRYRDIDYSMSISDGVFEPDNLRRRPQLEKSSPTE